MAVSVSVFRKKGVGKFSVSVSVFRKKRVGKFSVAVSVFRKKGVGKFSVAPRNRDFASLNSLSFQKRENIVFSRSRSFQKKLDSDNFQP